jgi:hypothetical protein
MVDDPYLQYDTMRIVSSLRDSREERTTRIVTYTACNVMYVFICQNDDYLNSCYYTKEESRSQSCDIHAFIQYTDFEYFYTGDGPRIPVKTWANFTTIFKNQWIFYVGTEYSNLSL